MLRNSFHSVLFQRFGLTDNELDHFVPVLVPFWVITVFFLILLEYWGGPFSLGVAVHIGAILSRLCPSGFGSVCGGLLTIESVSSFCYGKSLFHRDASSRLKLNFSWCFEIRLKPASSIHLGGPYFLLRPHDLHIHLHNRFIFFS